MRPLGDSIPHVRTFAVYHVPMLLYAAVIITLSSIPNLQGPDLHFVAFDKLAHFVEYAIFAFLAFRSFARLTPTISATTAGLLAIGFVSGFAGLDEYYQSYIPGRYADSADLVTDIVAAVVVVAVSWVLHRRRGERAFRTSNLRLI